MILDVGIGGGTIGGTIADTQIAFGTAADTIGGSADLTWVTDGLTVLRNAAIGAEATLNQVYNPFGFGPTTQTTTLSLKQDVSDLSVSGHFDVGVQSWMNLIPSAPAGSVVQPIAARFIVTVPDTVSETIPQTAVMLITGVFSGTGDITSIYGNDSEVYFEGASGTISSVYGQYAFVENDVGQTLTKSYGLYATGTQNYSTGDIGAGYGVYVPSPANEGGGTVGVNIAFYAAAQGHSAIANSYAFWADEDGVYRIKADDTFDSVYQAIPALYNPQFTKYTPGAANYERIVEYWTGNVATVGTEAGGTGTLRALNLIGSVVTVNGVPISTSATDFAPSLMLMGG